MASAAVAVGVTSGSSRKRLMRDEDMTKVEFETSEEVDVTPTFDTMGLREDLLRGIYAYGERREGTAFYGRNVCSSSARGCVRASFFVDYEGDDPTCVLLFPVFMEHIVWLPNTFLGLGRVKLAVVCICCVPDIEISLLVKVRKIPTCMACTHNQKILWKILI